MRNDFYRICYIIVKNFTMEMMERTQTEALLLHQARAGDRQAFAEIVRRYENLVYSFAFKVCRNKEKASETLHDTFINVYRKLDQFDHRSKFTTWLYSIVTNNCLMKHRKTKLTDATIALEELDVSSLITSEHRTTVTSIPKWEETPIDQVMNDELKDYLDQAIQKLPMDSRLVFILRDVEGRSAEETAKILKITVPAVKSRLHRARIFLRKQLNEYMTS
jgi:RNA polymerase sigma-70 factor, ECF subfamily